MQLSTAAKTLPNRRHSSALHLIDVGSSQPQISNVSTESPAFVLAGHWLVQHVGTGTKPEDQASQSQLILPTYSMILLPIFCWTSSPLPATILRSAELSGDEPRISTWSAVNAPPRRSSASG